MNLCKKEFCQTNLGDAGLNNVKAISLLLVFRKLLIYCCTLWNAMFFFGIKCVEQICIMGRAVMG